MTRNSEANLTRSAATGEPDRFRPPVRLADVTYGKNYDAASSRRTRS
jgi:hypothetical protein